MMLLVLSVILSAALAAKQHCECWDGYKAEHNKTGWQCVGVNLFHIMPCNMARVPKCQCSGRFSSVLKDRTGTWCTQYSKGTELRRWPCENTREWKEFFAKNPDFI